MWRSYELYYNDFVPRNYKIIILLLIVLIEHAVLCSRFSVMLIRRRGAEVLECQVSDGGCPEVASTSLATSQAWLVKTGRSVIGIINISQGQARRRRAPSGELLTSIVEEMQRLSA